MTLSRRSLIHGGAAGLGALALGGLVGCSTAAPGTGSTAGSGSTASGETMNLILWTWPEGFGKKALDAVASETPASWATSVSVAVIGGDSFVLRRRGGPATTTTLQHLHNLAQGPGSTRGAS